MLKGTVFTIRSFDTDFTVHTSVAHILYLIHSVPTVHIRFSL
jgi:hypothetical protein